MSSEIVDEDVKNWMQVKKLFGVKIKLIDELMMYVFFW